MSHGKVTLEGNKVMHTADDKRKTAPPGGSTLSVVIGLFDEYMTGSERARLTRENLALEALRATNRASTAAVIKIADQSSADTQAFLKAVRAQDEKVAKLLGDTTPGK